MELSSRSGVAALANDEGALGVKMKFIAFESY